MAGLKFNDMALPVRVSPKSSANHLYGLYFKSAAKKAITSSGVVAWAFANLAGHNGGSIKATASRSLIHRIDNSELSQAYTQPTVCLPLGPISRATGDASSSKRVTI